MAKLFLIDAYALIYRSYYALIRNPRINSKGFNTSAILGFCNTLNEIITKENPTHIGVAFDHGKTFRHDAYPEYKAQREETPEDIRKSVPVIKGLLKAMNIPILQVNGFEADDIIGTLASKAGQQGIETYMLTPDKDYGQLIADNIYMYKPRHGGGYDIIGKEQITEKYGISYPIQIIDLLALMGDSSDNYPGCPGVGEKTAVKLINEFGNIDNLLMRTNELKGKMREKVENAAEDIRMSYFLASIRTDVPIVLNLDELAKKEPDEKELEKIFTELEFKTLANKFIKKSKQEQNLFNSELDIFTEYSNETQEESNNGSFDSIKTITHTYELVDSEDRIKELCDFFLTCKILSLDTETTSTNAIDAELVGLSFSTEESKAFYVPVPENKHEAQKIVDIFKEVYENPSILKIGQNIKYDITVLRKYGVEMKGELFDCMIAHYLLQPELRHNMDYMAEAYLNYKTIHIDELIGHKGKSQKSMRDLSPIEVYEYACEDADITLKLYHILEPKLKELNIFNLFKDIEMPLINVLVEMEMNGVILDTSSLTETSRILQQRILEKERKIYEEAGTSFNIASPKQVGEILFDRLKISDKAKKTKTGQYVTSEEALTQLKHRAPIVENILAYRGLRKLLSTYVEALPKLINKHTGHIHTSFNQAITATGRLSSSDPNLQNIPVKGEDGKELRRCFIPESGWLFFSVDYSQIDLCVIVLLSGVEGLIDAFRNGYDIHAATAARIFKETMEHVTRDQRSMAKRANFGIIYGITVFGLAQNLDIDRNEAKKLIDDYFQSFPKVKEYMERCKETARSKGYAETIFHRRRYLPDINSGNATVRGFAERNSINAPIQGSAADIIKLAMVRIYKRFKDENIKSKMILQVHDELNFSVFPEEKESVERIVIEEMQNACQLKVPLIADCGWGANWLEAH